MSYMSLFEKSAKNTAAISILNKVRHWLQGRKNSELRQEEKAAFLEASQHSKENRFENLVIYSLQGLGDDLLASAPQINAALTTAAREFRPDDGLYDETIKAVSSAQVPSNEAKKRRMIEYLEFAVSAISNSGEEFAKPNPFSARSRGL